MTTQGKRLQKIRKSLNITQEALGEILEVSKQVISNIEADRVLLNNDKLVSLGKNFNVNTDYLLLGRGGMFFDTQLNVFAGSNLHEEIRKTIKEMITSGEIAGCKLLCSH